MNILDILILSAVEGATEFLPISSTAHLVLTSHLLGLSQTELIKTFEIVIQSGAIIAGIWYFWTKINPKILISYIPTALIGLLFYPIVKNYLIGNLLISAIALFIGGVVLILIKERSNHTNNFTYKDALVIGLAQSVSLIPGISRSASVIVAGMLLGKSKLAATEFSFMLAIPTILSATLLDIYKSYHLFKVSDWPVLALGLATSAIFASLSIHFFIAFLKKNTLRFFGYYRIILALVILSLLYL